MPQRPQWLFFLLIFSCVFIMWREMLPYLGGWLASLVAVLLAVLAAHFLHDGWWWKWIHALFLPALILAQSFGLHGAWYLFAFIVSWLIFGRVMSSRVPLFLSNAPALQQLELLIPKDAHFVDVGAGTGTVLQYLARSRADVSLAGIEAALGPWLYGRLRLPRHIRWIRSQYQSHDLAQFDCVYAFLSPAAMPELWLQARQQMRSGSVFISNTFTVPGEEPDQIIELNDWKNGQLLLWRM